MVLQNYQTFKETTSNMFYLLHLYSYIIKQKNLLNILKKKEFPNKKKKFPNKKKKKKKKILFFKEMTSNMFYLLHLYSYIIK